MKGRIKRIEKTMTTGVGGGWAYRIAEHESFMTNWRREKLEALRDLMPRDRENPPDTTLPEPINIQTRAKELLNRFPNEEAYATYLKLNPGEWDLTSLHRVMMEED